MIPAMEPTLTTVPRLREAMCGMTAFAVRTVAKTLVLKMRMISSISTSMRGAVNNARVLSATPDPGSRA